MAGIAALGAFIVAMWKGSQAVNAYQAAVSAEKKRQATEQTRADAQTQALLELLTRSKPE